MSVKIRLTRMGKKKQPTYRVVVMDSRKPRDGAYLEQIGRYDPRQDPSIVEIDNERAMDWLMKGAQPTERARKLLEISGAWMQFRVAKGDVYTVGEPEATADTAVADTAVEAPVPATPEHTPEVHVVGDPLPQDEPDANGEDSEDASDASSEEPAGEDASPQSEDTTDAASAGAAVDDKEES